MSTTRRKYVHRSRHTAEIAWRESERQKTAWMIACRTLASSEAMDRVIQFTEGQWACCLILRHPRGDWLRQGAIVILSPPDGDPAVMWLEDWDGVSFNPQVHELRLRALELFDRHYGKD